MMKNIGRTKIPPPPTPAPREEKEKETVRQERKGQIAVNYRLERYAFQKQI